VKAGVGLAAGSLSDALRARPQRLAWVNRASGAILVGLGLRLAATER
jgi:threonine/homoserine/homoserine lactone efflux protein